MRRLLLFALALVAPARAELRPVPTQKKGIVSTALRKAFAGGATGSIAGVAQVAMFMWLRTVMNYQYRHGGETLAVLRQLWEEGGVRRLYRGLPYAVIQGPLSRFGSACANTLVLELRKEGGVLAAYPLVVVTALGSVLTAIYRFLLMPIDTCKTVSQVEGRAGLDFLVSAVLREGQIGLLYTGGLAMGVATLFGHYPWFLTFNVLDRIVTKPQKSGPKALRSAAIGFSSSVVSDIVANPIRVVKTTKQASAAHHHYNNNNNNLASAGANSYAAIVADIVNTEGVQALFWRGIKTRILANGLQSMVFTVLWRHLLEGSE
ncbi:hypothetical protein CTAYLR_010177 [Chrysophaeum taylorii]|uniref:Mitochondrial carrier protein n=1 Tax=Chrysophaeum taylorii TaxID=2483200 RepID=A0AAD7ULJ8_9STRA|nr:hypothetical protein CTAYLR_010177 [Chrysophaeum taylorii]